MVAILFEIVCTIFLKWPGRRCNDDVWFLVLLWGNFVARFTILSFQSVYAMSMSEAFWHVDIVESDGLCVGFLDTASAPRCYLPGQYVVVNV